MKKIISVVIMISALLLLCLPASAKATYADAAALFGSWCGTKTENGAYSYPSYVCGVWTETEDSSQIVIAVTKDEAGEAGKAEILDLIENDDSVKFTYAAYSYAELWEVDRFIVSQMGGDFFVIGCGISERENVVEASIDFGKSGSKDFMNAMFEKYGNKIKFVNTFGMTFEASAATIDVGGNALTIGIDSADEGRNGGVWIWLSLAGLAIAAAGALWFSRKRWIPALSTTAGNIVTKEAEQSVTATEKQVSEACIEPSAELDEKIKDQINKITFAEKREFFGFVIRLRSEMVSE